MSETIIIESNREIAYKDELKSLKIAKINEGIPDFPNNKWRTQIQSGISLEVGDQIQIEATMIQQKGSPEETIEISADKNIKNSFGFLDNKAVLEFQYYITNRQQFNCPLPLIDTQINNQVGSESTPDYGLIDVSTFDNFVKAYPYRGIEGMYKDVNGIYQQVDSGGVFSRPPQPIDDSSPIRFYLLNSDGKFKSFETIDNSVIQPDYTISTVNLEIQEGFQTPENIAQKITEQFHERDGTSEGWQNNFVEPLQFNLVGNNIIASSIPLISDKTYRSISTSTGDLLRGRLEGQWATKFSGESGSEGDNYTTQQGLNFLYKNLLCGNPEQFIATTKFMNLRVNFTNGNNVFEDFSTGGIYTGHTNIINNIGQYGCNLCLLDQLDFNDTTITYIYPTDRLTTSSVFMDFLDINENELIVSNALYNPHCIEILADSLIKLSTANEGFTPSTQMNQENKYEYYSSKFKFGRSDDLNSLGANSTKIHLPCPFVIKTNPVSVPKSYQTIPSGKCYVGFAFNGNYDAQHSVRIKTYYNDKLNQHHPQKINFTFPSQSKFSLKNTKGQYFQQDFSKDNNCAIIPVFYKETHLPNENLRDVPFCAFINIDRIRYDGDNPIQIPAPIEGEFFGLSPSCYDNLLSKVVSTQKTTNGQGTYPDHTEVNTRPYSYASYCMIGADNPSLKFDDNSSRMSLSNFHTAVRAGNGIFQEVLDKANDQASIESMCVNSTDSAICGTSNLNAIIPYGNIIQTNFPFPVISSQSGIALSNIYYTDIDGNYIKLDTNIPQQFSDTLFDKLGFICEQLLPFEGKRQNQFNRSNYNKYIGNNVEMSDKLINMVKPFTTNAYISGADQISIVKNAAQQQMENLGTTSLYKSTYINAESDELIAQNLASKLDYPYLVVYSDIVRNTKFYGGKNGQQKVPAMAYLSRNYSTGDYFYTFSTGWNYTIDNPYILTDFSTEIMLPDGSPAPINKDSSVIYKITKPMNITSPQEIIDNEKENKQKTKN